MDFCDMIITLLTQLHITNILFVNMYGITPRVNSWVTPSNHTHAEKAIINLKFHLKWTSKYIHIHLHNVH